MSGHSKWHNIQKTKGAADAKRAQAFTKIAREMIAAFLHGDDHFTRDLGEGLGPLGVRSALGFLYIVPLGMSGHNNSSSCA